MPPLPPPFTLAVPTGQVYRRAMFTVLGPVLVGFLTNLILADCTWDTWFKWVNLAPKVLHDHSWAQMVSAVLNYSK